MRRDGRFKTFDGTTRLVAGVKSRPSRGHTARHPNYVVESNAERLLRLGDLMHVAAAQFAESAVTFNVDVDSQAVARERKLADADAIRNGYWVGVAHVAFPGLGHLRSEGTGYLWIPANDTSLR